MKNKWKGSLLDIPSAAKNRKSHNCECDPSGDGLSYFENDANKSYRTACHGVRRIFISRMRKYFAGRYKDIMAITGLWLSWVLGYRYSTQELLQPADMLAVRCISFVAHVIFLLAIASWVAVIVHGPGRVPVDQGSGSQLPQPIADCLEIGRFLKKKPFSSEDGWCQKCSRWKPALANHCSICGMCCLWMDHHCNFAGQCIGFRNLRSFLLMQLYTQLLIIIHMPLVVRRLWLEPLPFFDLTAAIKLTIFVSGGLNLRRLVRFFFSSVLGKISRGWPSYVLMCKFGCVMEHAQTLEQNLSARAQKLSDGCPDEVSSVLEKMKNIQQRVLIPGRFGGANLRGIFVADRFWPSVALVFGEPFSWRWLNPIKSGGTGDPLAPCAVNPTACAAWAELGPILQELQALIESEPEQLQTKEIAKEQARDQVLGQARKADEQASEAVNDHIMPSDEHSTPANRNATEQEGQDYEPFAEV